MANSISKIRFQGHSGKVGWKEPSGWRAHLPPSLFNYVWFPMKGHNVGICDLTVLISITKCFCCNAVFFFCFWHLVRNNSNSSVSFWFIILPESDMKITWRNWSWDCSPLCVHHSVPHYPQSSLRSMHVQQWPRICLLGQKHTFCPFVSKLGFLEICVVISPSPPTSGLVRADLESF